jgi:hypothetical protein
LLSQRPSLPAGRRQGCPGILFSGPVRPGIYIYIKKICHFQAAGPRLLLDIGFQAIKI